jgi:addiction module HigA family antidote
MNIEFKNIALEELYTKGTTQDHQYNLTPFVATHPGEMIRDELKERGMTQKQLAAESGIKPSVLSETINGKRSVSLNVALALEKTLGISADIWMNLQTQYDLDMANIAERGNQRETVSVTIPVKDRNLLQELVRKFGWACVF